jgi:hypothetical protein
MSPKSIYLTDEQYKQIVKAAQACGYRVQRGRGSQLAQFVVAAANIASTRTAGILPAQADTIKSDNLGESSNPA